MSAASRVLRSCRINSPSLRCTCLSDTSPVLQPLLPRPRVRHLVNSATARARARPVRPKHLALDRTTLVVGFVASAAIAYIIARWGSDEVPNDPASSPDSSTSQWNATLSLYPRTMAPSMPPGRPGNLTPNQEARLKEMWAATLEVFGVGHDSLEEHGSGTATPDTTGEAKKKRKSRLSMFKRDKSHKTSEGNGTTAAESENDKHGQSKEFQEALASQTPEQLRDAFWSMSKLDHPDALLLRFLRARKWDVHAALIMMVSTMHWRSRDMHVDDDIMVHGEEAACRDSKNGADAATRKEGEDFLAQLRLGKSFVHGLDKESRPCCYVRVRLHRQGEQSERSLERYTVHMIETTRLMLRPPVDTATIVFDMTDFSMANMDYTPVKFMIKCFEANYPESLGSVLVYRAPWIFQGIWKIIRGWLDPVVAGKVHFTSNIDDLAEWIPRSQIMRELGGDEDYTYSYVEPAEGESAQLNEKAGRDPIEAERRELVNSYETLTLNWIQGEDEAAARNRVAERLSENYWRLDPYIRARSLYDRTGVIGEGGKLNFYPRAQQAGAVNGADDDVD